MYVADPPGLSSYDARARSSDSDWVLVADQWMFVVGYTSGGAPFGSVEDDFAHDWW